MSSQVPSGPFTDSLVSPDIAFQRDLCVFNMATMDDFVPSLAIQSLYEHLVTDKLCQLLGEFIFVNFCR